MGDVVRPQEGSEFLFVDESVVGGGDPIEVEWSGGVGLVVGVMAVPEPRSYVRVRMVVGGRVGWTYSDYVEVVVR